MCRAWVSGTRAAQRPSAAQPGPSKSQYRDPATLRLPRNTVLAAGREGGRAVQGLVLVSLPLLCGDLLNSIKHPEVVNPLLTRY